LIRSPPKVKVVPQVTTNPVKDGAPIGNAQFDFGGTIPSVRLPPRTDGS
jgi:hypothetical protein